MPSYLTRRVPNFTVQHIFFWLKSLTWPGWHSWFSQWIVQSRLRLRSNYPETTVCLTGQAVIDHWVILTEESIQMDWASSPPRGSACGTDILIIHSQPKPYMLGLFWWLLGSEGWRRTRYIHVGIWSSVPIVEGFWALREAEYMSSGPGVHAKFPSKPPQTFDLDGEFCNNE